MKLIRLCLCLMSIILPYLTNGQNEAIPSIKVKKINENVKLDGVLDEAVWQSSPKTSDFWQFFPLDTMKAQYQTEVYMAYDAKNLYIAAKCYSKGNDYVIPSYRRDFRAGGSCNMTFVLDPFNDRTNAFVFGTNPYGVLREALISNGGQDLPDFSTAWDNKWKGESKIFDGYWTCEIAIPFTTLRFKEGSKIWRFNAYRFDTQGNEQSSWFHIPRNQLIFNLAFMGQMEWEEPLQKSGVNASVIPYLSGNTTQNFQLGEDKPTLGYGIGGDVKLGVSSGLNLDLTFNPDFSQVEVDRQLTNLSRFELFFPEQRQFFLENADLFSNFGQPDVSPFFSRRIGVTTDTLTGQNINNPILFGARLSGKLDNNWRVGALTMQTAKDAKNGLPSYNYSVAALQRKVFSRSNIGLVFVNKQDFSATKSTNLNPFNRVLGLDYNLASDDNKWAGKTFYHQSFGPEKKKGQFAHGANLNYNILNWQIGWGHQIVGENFDAQVGFVPRTNFYSFSPTITYTFYPNKKVINTSSFGIEYNQYGQPNLGRTDQVAVAYWSFSSKNTAEFTTGIYNGYSYMFSPFDPSGTGGTPLPVGTEYLYTDFFLEYTSDQRKKLFFKFSPWGGQYYNGTALNLEGSAIYRFQPYGTISLDMTYTRIRLPKPYASSDLLLIGPRLDLTFNKSLFLTAFFQYNNQINNFNINTRLQWRYKPVSDLFLLFTNNYFADDLKVKNRAFVLKWTYWLNI